MELANYRHASRRLPIQLENVIQYGVWGLTILLVLAPLVPIFYSSLLDRPLYDQGGIVSLANYLRLFTISGFPLAIWNTIQFAVLSTALAVLLGTLLAVAIGRTDLPGRALFAELILVPVYLPSLIIAVGWIALFAPSGFVTVFVSRQLGFPTWDLYSIPGMAFLAATVGAPIVYLYTSSSVSLANASLEDAARSSGASPLRVLLTVTIPLLRPAILQSALFVFAVGVEVLSIPLMMGTPARIDFIVSFLYRQWVGKTPPDHGLINAAAIVLLIFVSGLVLLRMKLLGNTQRFITLRGQATAPNLFRLGNLRWVLFGLLAATVLVFIVLPMIGIVLMAFTTVLTPLVPPWTVFTLDWFALIFEEPIYVRSIVNSIVIGLVGSVGTTFLIALIALVAHRSSFRFKRSLDFVAMYTRTIPGMIVGMGFFWAFALVPVLGPLRNTIMAILLAFSVRNITTAYGAVYPMLDSIGAELDDAARTVGANWWSACRAILLPLMRPALLSCTTLMFLSLFREFDPAVFLVSPGNEVVGLTMLQVWGQGFAGPVAAFALIQMAIILAFVAISRFILKVRLYG